MINVGDFLETLLILGAFGGGMALGGGGGFLGNLFGFGKKDEKSDDSSPAWTSPDSNSSVIAPATVESPPYIEQPQNEASMNYNMSMQNAHLAELEQQTHQMDSARDMSEEQTERQENTHGMIIDGATVAGFTAGGAAIGSIVPGLGTAIGAGLGALTGTVVAFGDNWGWW